ncbi:MAG: hypothetical protein N3E40_00180 [Dehalococcoidia bacterium]|nr:hypothetical protein [Dehalococcoidia bacterium]
MFTSVEVAQNRAGTGHNLVLGFELDDTDPDRPGMPFQLYLPLPTLEVYQNFQDWIKAGRPTGTDNGFLMADAKRHRYQAMMSRIKRVSGALGGPESGDFEPGVLARFIGKKVKLNLQPERDSGRIGIAYDGVAPA